MLVLLNGCVKLLYWQELEHAVVYTNPEHTKHAQWVTCPVSMLAMQELGCFQLPGILYIIMLQHEVMVVDEWQTMGLRISSRYLCAFKMPSIKCTCVVKPGFIREENTSPDAIECEHLPTQVGYDDELQSGRDPDEDDEHADELP